MLGPKKPAAGLALTADDRSSSLFISKIKETCLWLARDFKGKSF